MFSPDSRISAYIFITNIFISILALFIDRRVQDAFMLSPFQVWHQRRWDQVVTSGFVHANLRHLIFNMLTFYFFGPFLEYKMGHLHFALLYLCCLVFSDVTTIFRHRNNPVYRSLGASGAVQGVVFSFILFEPLAKIIIPFPPIAIPAFIFAILFFAYSFYESRRGTSYINHDAHILGALTGIIYTILWNPEMFRHFLKQIISYFSS